jgi:glycosyltransferase involved in cell wall biosynthesis
MRVCMLLHKSVAHDTRVRREATALASAGHEVTVVHLPPTDINGETDGLPFVLAPGTLRHGRQRLPHSVRLGAEAARPARRAIATRPDAVHAHDAAMLLPGLLAARRSRAKLVYDSHELATGVPYRSRAWAGVVFAAERLGAPRADATIVVSDGIAERLAERYSLRRRPVVIRNLAEPPPSGVPPVADLRRELSIGDAPLIMHQGAVTAGRGCAVLVRALPLVEGAHLLFLGAEGPDGEPLRAIALRSGCAERIHLLPPVPPEALRAHTTQADVGVSLLEDSCENHRLALPNKLFEYLAAGLPVVVADLPEAARMVREYDVGWPADPADPVAVASALRAALAQRSDEGLRQRIARAGAELSWKREQQRLLSLYDELGRG